jgi:hypothetical protein
MTKQIRIENADTSDHKIKVEVWEKNSIQEDGKTPADKLVRVVDLNIPTQMIQETIWANRYLVVREVTE